MINYLRTNINDGVFTIQVDALMKYMFKILLFMQNKIEIWPPLFGLIDVLKYPVLCTLCTTQRKAYNSMTHS